MSSLVLGTTLPILIIGTIGNVLTLCVLSRPAFANKSLPIFLGSLAITDLLTLWMDPLTVIILDTEFETSTAEVACRVYIWAFALVSIASSWILVLVTLERVVVVYRPLTVHAFCTQKRAIMSVVLIWFLWAAIGSFTFAIDHDWTGKCKPSTTLLPSELIVFMSLYSVIPALVLLTCNVLIIVALRRAKSIRRRMSTTTYTTQQDKLTIMLLTNSFVFVLLTLPEILVYAIENFQDTTVPDAAVWFCNFLRRLNHAVNFLLYCFSGVMFRRELVEMFLGLVSKLGCRKNVDIPKGHYDGSANVNTPLTCVGAPDSTQSTEA